MKDYSVFLDSISDFREAHRLDVAALIESFETSYVDAINLCGLHSGEHKLKKLLRDFEIAYRLTGIEAVIDRLNQSMYDIETELITPRVAKKKDAARKKAVRSVLMTGDRLIGAISAANRGIIQEVNDRWSVIENLPFGYEEDRNKNAETFERNVNELLSWLFIDEARLLTNAEIKQEHLIRDGVFEIEDGFS